MAMLNNQMVYIIGEWTNDLVLISPTPEIIVDWNEIGTQKKLGTIE